MYLYNPSIRKNTQNKKENGNENEKKKFVMHLPLSPALRVGVGREPLRIGAEKRGPNSRRKNGENSPSGDILRCF